MSPTMRIYNRKLRHSFRLDGQRVLGGAQILTAIVRLGSLSASAKELKMSYRFVEIHPENGRFDLVNQ